MTERTLLLITMMIGTFMAALDGSIVNISLPAMALQFHASLTQIEWVVLAYMIAFAVSIPLTGWLRETVGFRWLYMGSLLIFVVGSLFCGMATTLDGLVLARVLQAFGGGALTPTAMAILSTVYSSNERGKALGIWGLGVVIGPALGPTLGGILTARFGWPSIFLINVPIGIIGIALAAKVLNKPKLQNRSKEAFDLFGFISLSVFLISLMLAVTALEKNSNLSRTLFMWAVAISSLLIFIKISLTHKHPILDLRIFKNRLFTACSLVTFARSAGLYGGLFLLPFLMQNLLGFSELKSGLLMLPGSALLAVLMPFAGKWTDQNGPRNITMTGLILVSGSLALFSFVPLYTTALMLLAAMVLRGFGLGLLVTPISTATVNSVPADQVTLASSVSSLMQQCGGAVGISVFAMIHQTAFQSAGDFGHDAHAAESYALKLSFLTTSGALLLALIPASRLPRVIISKNKAVEPLLE